ncbi:hypothetical protein GCM10022420_022170 [Streptomyces iranensis]
MVAHTVTSVGPYAFTIRRPGAHRSTNPGEHASPATTSDRKLPGNSSTAANTDGGTVTCVTPNSATTSPNDPPGGNLSTPAITNTPPDNNAIHISETAASKLNDANCNTRASAPTPNRSICAAAKFPMPRCVTTTPFGRPVDPDV